MDPAILLYSHHLHFPVSSPDSRSLAVLIASYFFISVVAYSLYRQALSDCAYRFASTSRFVNFFRFFSLLACSLFGIYPISFHFHDTF